jgi:hypothetical protein
MLSSEPEYPAQNAKNNYEVLRGIRQRKTDTLYVKERNETSHLIPTGTLFTLGENNKLILHYPMAEWTVNAVSLNNVLLLQFLNR